MQTIRTTMRTLGRLLVCIFIATLIFTSWTNRQPTHQLYLSKYDRFRDMLFLTRIVDLPPSCFIEGLFDIFYWTKMGYLVLMGAFILLGKKWGGRMMALYFSIKMVVWYLPTLLRTPKMPFTSRDFEQMLRQIAILGVSIALTQSPKEQKTQNSDDPSAKPKKE